MLFFAACSLTLPDIQEGSQTEPEIDLVWDNQNSARLNAYENDILIWYEVYEGGAGIHKNEPLTQVQRFLPDNRQLWTKRYSYTAEESLALFAYYSGTDTKATWFIQYIYDTSGRNIREITWDNTGTSPVVETQYAYGYTSADTFAYVYRFLGSTTLESAWTYTYNAGLLTQQNKYEGDQSLNGTRTGYITYEYDETERPTVFTGYGTIDFQGFAPESGETSQDINFSYGTITAGSKAIMSMPTPPAPPAVPNPAFTETSLDLYWKATWIWDDMFGGEEGNFTGVHQNAAAYPVLLHRYYKEGSAEKTIELALHYNSGNLITGKTISLNGTQALAIEYGYADEYLSSITCTGPVMPLPMELAIDYDEHNLPSGMVLTTNGEVLRSFAYGYKNSIEPGNITRENFIHSVLDITESNGDGEVIARYTFSYDDIEETLEIAVTSNDRTITGCYRIYYNSEGLSAGIVCYSSSDNGVTYDAEWSYRYSYNDAHRRISEFKEDLDGLFENINSQDIDSLSIDDMEGVPFINEAYGIDVETLFEDIRNYLPFY